MATTVSIADGALLFQSQLRRIEVNTEDSELTASVATGSVVLLSATYTPDTDGNITIYDLDKLIEPYTESASIATMSITIGDWEGTITVLRDAATTGEADAAYFASNYWLTPMRHERNTAIGRKETLTALCPNGEEAVTVAARYWDGNSVLTKNFEGGTISDIGEVDCSPELYDDESLGRLIGYSVKCGARSMDFRVCPRLPRAFPAFKYRNCFGAWDIIYFTGMSTQKPEYTRNWAKIGGKAVMYQIDEVMQFKSQTGPLRRGMLAMANDLARSKDVYLIGPDDLEDQSVIITDLSNEASNEDGILPDFAYTWRLADPWSEMASGLSRARIFDYTFDATYD